MISEPESSSPDDGLDQILAEARWAEVEAARVARLRGRWQSLSAARRRRAWTMRISVGLAASLACALVLWWVLPTSEHQVGTQTVTVEEPRPPVVESTPPLEAVEARPMDEVTVADSTIADSTGSTIRSPQRFPVEAPRATPPDIQPGPQSRPPTTMERMMFAASERRRLVQTDARRNKLLDKAIAKLVREPDVDVSTVADRLRPARTSHASQLVKIAGSTAETSERRAATRLLGVLGDATAVPALIELSQAGETRDVALPALLRLADADTLGELIARESNEKHRQELLAGLLEQGTAASTARFLRFVQATSSRHTAIASLARCNDPPIPLLFEFLDSPQLPQRLSAGRVLGRLCDSRVVEHLIGMAQKDPFREEAMVALLQCPGDRATDFVRFARNSPRLRPSVHAAEIQLQITSSYRFRTPWKWEIN